MKKTLFLALALGLSGLVQATVTAPETFTKDGRTAVDIFVYGTETNPASLSGGVVCVGNYHGYGNLTLSSGSAYNLANSLYIGGRGYLTPDSYAANDGEVTVSNGTTLAVGAGTSSAAGSHINVGNAVSPAVTGKLNILSGATVSGSQLVVGQENGGKGEVVVDGGTLDLTNYNDGSNYSGVLIRNGSVTVKNSGSLSNDDADTFVAGDLTIEGSATAELGTVVVGGDTPAASGSVTVADGALVTVGENMFVQQSGSVTVSGTSAELQTTGEVIVNGATVTVEEGAALSADYLEMNGASSSLKVTGDDSSLSVNTDAFVGAGATVELENGAALAADNVVLGTGSSLSMSGTDLGGTGSQMTVFSGVYAEQNSLIEMSDGATLDTSTAALDTGAKIDMSGASAMNATQEVYLTAGSQIDMSDTSSLTVDSGIAAAPARVILEEHANINLSGTADITASDVTFTIADSNQSGTGHAQGQIHLLDTTATSNIDKAHVVIDGSMLNQLVAGHREIVLVSADTGAAKPAPNQVDVTWGVHQDTSKGDISYTVDTDIEGLVLNLTMTDPQNPGQGPDDLANEIIDALVTPTSAATINTLHGTISALNGLFNVVKSQLMMPHNIERPVGKVADESVLAYTGRYYVGANRAWVSGLGASDRVATDFNGEGYHYSGGGYAIGYDRVITPHMYVGAALGQMIGKYKANSELVRDSQKTYEGTLYAHYTHEMKKSDNRFNVDVYVGAGRARNRSRGALSLGAPMTATARWNDTTIGAGVKLSYDIVLSDTQMLTPFVALEGIYATQDSYDMSDGATTLRYHDGKAGVATIPVGMTYRHIISVDKTGYIVPQVTVAYLGDIARKTPEVKYDWTSGTGIVRGAKPGHNGFELEAGATWILNSEWSTGAFYTVDERSGECYQQVKAFVSYSF